MKKRDIRRRLKTLFTSIKEYFLEEEPREKASRTLKEAGIHLNRTVYQRIALEYELQYRNLDQETKAWLGTTLEALRQTEQQQTQLLVVLREEFRKLTLQDLLYRALNEPDSDTFQQAHEALLELSASVETEKSIQSIPKLLSIDPVHPSPAAVDPDNRDKTEDQGE